MSKVEKLFSLLSLVERLKRMKSQEQGDTFAATNELQDIISEIHIDSKVLHLDDVRFRELRGIINKLTQSKKDED